MAKQVFNKEFWDSLTPAEQRELVEAVEELLEKPTEGRRFTRAVIKPLRKKDRIEATYAVFKPIYKRLGKKFTKKDAEEVRENMLLFAQKLYEIQMKQAEEQNE